MNDKTIQGAVLDELTWEPSVDATHVGVAVRDGVVTLGGYVRTYAEKLAVERAAARVKGVKAIVEHVEVRLGASRKYGDEALAAHIAQALNWDVSLPLDRITATVENGWVELRGDVDWQYQKIAAFEDVHRLGGVVGVTNLIEVKPAVAVEAGEVRAKIAESFKRSAELDAGRISIRTDGGKVVLSGDVRSWHERCLAERAAWSAPGVTEVRDEIRIV